MTTNTRTSLPEIVRFDGVNDSGEYGNATCPHCGAKGRYVYRFQCADGTHRGAMAGCIKLFPVSPIAAEHGRIVERQRERDAKGQKLAGWDVAKLEAIEAVYAGTMTVDAALDVIRDENYRRDTWMAKKGYRR